MRGISLENSKFKRSDLRQQSHQNLINFNQSNVVPHKRTHSKATRWDCYQRFYYWLFFLKFGWNQLKNIVIKWIFLITTAHTHLFTNRFQFYSTLFSFSFSLSFFLSLLVVSGLWVFFDHRNPIFDLYNLVKANRIMQSKTPIKCLCSVDVLLFFHRRTRSAVWQNW